MSSTVEVLETWLRRVWRERDPSAIAELLQQDATLLGSSAFPMVGPAEFLLFHKMMLAQFSSIRIDIVHTVCEGDWCAAIGSMSGVAASTGRRVQATGQVLLTASEGKIRWFQAHFDFLSIFEQTGQLPPGTFQTCLAGGSPFSAEPPRSEAAQ